MEAREKNMEYMRRINKVQVEEAQSEIKQKKTLGLDGTMEAWKC